MRLSLALSLAIAAGASASASASVAAAEGQRDLQDSVACLATGGDFASCCPAGGADPDDGVCTLLTCLDLSGGGASIRDACSCADIVTGCGGVAAFAGVVPQLPDMCASVGTCCADDGSTTNGDWDACMAEADPRDDRGRRRRPRDHHRRPRDGDDRGGRLLLRHPGVLPPPSIMCLAGALSGAEGSSFVDCCPEATPDDGICTMLWCIDVADLTVKDGCECSQLETSCAQLADSCMGGKGLTPPDFASLVPGGLPEELGGEPAVETDATEAPPATEEEETETTTVPDTEAAPVPPAATGGGAGRSAGAALAASALVAVACSALVRV